LSSGFRQSYPYEEWFLAGEEDVRSSYRLEVAATEFEIQGLELDWTGICWGGDLTWNTQAGGWRYRRLSGSTWQSVRKPEDQTYLCNKYRVLLTRAREGAIVWDPIGSSTDPTRDPESLDETANYFAQCGIRPLRAHTG
jgi:hypothetical protein